MIKVRRSGETRSERHSKDDHGRAHRARPARVEPSTFAWIEPLDDLEPVVVERVVEKEVVVEKPVVFEKVVEKVIEKPVPIKHGTMRVRGPEKAPSPAEASGKTIIIGRGPSIAERLVRVAPDPKPVLAGACALVIALAGVALISPSSERATASRSTVPLGATDGPSASVPAGLGLTDNDAAPKGEKRDPFVAKGYTSPKRTGEEAAGKAGKRAKARDGKDSAKSRDRGRRATTPASAKPSLYAATFVTYSTYTPWMKTTRRSGGWIEFDGKPTVKIVSVDEKLVELFVVTDVEVLPDRSRAIDYSYPLRIVRVKPNGVVRFADYRDVQADDVEYTIRFRGSLPIDLTPAK